MSRKQKVPSLYIHRFTDSGRLEELEGDLGNTGHASEAILDFSTQNTGSTYAGILLNEAGAPTHICRFWRGQKAATARRKMNIADIESIDGIRSKLLTEIIKGSLHGRRKDKELKNITRLTPSENSAIISKIQDRDKHLADKLRLLGRADDRILASYSHKEREVLAFERDAVGLALGIAFDDRNFLRVPHTEEKVDSFLSLIDNVGKIEDEFIMYDKERFPNMEKLGVTPRRVTFEKNGAKLVVIHANRTKLETTLGVDLIYYAPRFGLVLGVQYKMMENRADGCRFIPEKGFQAQLDKMIEITKSVKMTPPSCDEIDLRLSSTPFFYKFVSRLEENFADDGLCPGLYMPLEFVSQMTSSIPVRPIEQLRDKCTRHLTNSGFADLVRDGWIGSYSTQLKLFEELIANAISMNRSLTIAIKDPPPQLI